MEAAKLMIVLFVVLTLLGSGFARFYILDDGERDYGALHRSKRQTHPSSTLARLPPDPFNPITDHIFAQEPFNARYGRQLGRPKQNPGPFQKWELGYIAGDILSPPAIDIQTEESRYRTIFNRPNRPEHLAAPDTDSSATVVWGTLKPGSKINHPFADRDQFRQEDYASQSSARSNYKPNYAQPVRHNYGGQRQVHYDEDEDSSEGRSDEDEDSAPPVRPVYTYVKTDKDGHFKWGCTTEQCMDNLAAMASNVDPQQEASDTRVRRDGHQGVTGPVHTFVKTDKHAHFKWGVRHHVGHQYAG